MAAATLEPRGRFLINGEPTENQLTIGQKGVLRADLIATGRAAHSAYPAEGESAIVPLLETLQRVQRITAAVPSGAGQLHAQHRAHQGGRAPNVIPDTRRRSFSSAPCSRMTASSARSRRPRAPRHGHLSAGDPQRPLDRAGRMADDRGELCKRPALPRRAGARATSSGPARFASPTPRKNASARPISSTALHSTRSWLATSWHGVAHDGPHSRRRAGRHRHGGAEVRPACWRIIPGSSSWQSPPRSRAPAASYGEVVRWRETTPLPQRIADLVVQRCAPPLEARVVFSALDAEVAGDIEQAFARAGAIVSPIRGCIAWIPTCRWWYPRSMRGTSTSSMPSGASAGGAARSSPTPTAPPRRWWWRSRRCMPRSASRRSSSPPCRRRPAPAIPGVASLDILANVVPFIGGEEEKMERETLKILGTLWQRRHHAAAMIVSRRTATACRSSTGTWRWSQPVSATSRRSTRPRRP